MHNLTALVDPAVRLREIANAGHLLDVVAELLGAGAEELGDEGVLRLVLDVRLVAGRLARQRGQAVELRARLHAAMRTEQLGFLFNEVIEEGGGLFSGRA